MDLWHWLINPTVCRHEIDKKLTKLLFDLYKQRKIQANEKRLPCIMAKGSNRPLINAQIQDSFQTHNTLKEGITKFLRAKFYCYLFQSCPQEGPMAFTRVNISWGK